MVRYIDILSPVGAKRRSRYRGSLRLARILWELFHHRGTEGTDPPASPVRLSLLSRRAGLSSRCRAGAPEIFGQDYADCTDQMQRSLETPLRGDPNA